MSKPTCAAVDLADTMDLADTVDFADMRKQVYLLLKKMCFSVVTNALTTTPAASGRGGYYFTHATLLPLQSKSTYAATVWVKKTAQLKTALILGPLILSNTHTPPAIGSVLVGELGTTNPNPGANASHFTTAHNTAGRIMSQLKRDSGNKRAYRWWASEASPLYELFEMVVKGTTLTEVDASCVLTQHDGFHDIWALARVVLFKNVACVANMLLPDDDSDDSTISERSTKMKLKQNPIMFIHNLSKLLSGDNGSKLIAYFRSLMPPISPSKSPSKTLPLAPYTEVVSAPQQYQYYPPPPPPSTTSSPTKPQYYDTKNYNTKDYNTKNYDKPCQQPQFSDAFFADLTSVISAVKQQTYVPSSPTYVPSSPTYVPSSPTYVPSSPTYTPASPHGYTHHLPQPQQLPIFYTHPSQSYPQQVPQAKAYNSLQEEPEYDPDTPAYF